MQTAPSPIPLRAATAGFRRFTVAEYHQMIDIGLLTEADDLELLDGYLVHKMTGKPPHDAIVDQVAESLQQRLPPGWRTRVQSAITLSTSEPEPDLAVVPGKAKDYLAHHPTAAEVALVVEVADTTLDSDRADKGRIYAREGITAYWIVNLCDRQIEVYTLPSGRLAAPEYAQRTDYFHGQQVPLTIAGVAVGTIPVDELLP